MGHYYLRMLDVYTDLTLQTTVFGTTIDLIESDELLALRRDVTDEEVRRKRRACRRYR